MKAKLAVQEVELWQKNSDIEALIAKIGQQTDKLNQERAVADAEEQKVMTVSEHQINQDRCSDISGDLRESHLILLLFFFFRKNVRLI